MSGILLVVGETASQSIGCGVESWEIRSAGTYLLNAPSSFPVITAKNLAPIFQAASRSRLRCPLQISHVASLPSLFRNNWSCHRHSDAAARSHTLDSTCSSGILKPQPPALSSWTVVVGSPSQDPCNPSHLELSQSYADAIQAFQTKRLSVDLSCWWSFQEMLGCLKYRKQAMMKTMKMIKIHQSMVLWKHVHWAFCTVLLALTVG